MSFPVAAQIKAPSSSSQAGKDIITLTTRDLPYLVIGPLLGDTNMKTHTHACTSSGLFPYQLQSFPSLYQPKVQVVWMKPPLYTLERDGQSDYVSKEWCRCLELDVGRQYDTQTPVKKHIAEHKICHVWLRLKFSRSESPYNTSQILNQTTERRQGIVAFRIWTGHKPAAAQAWLPSKPLTSHSSRTGISFRQLALCVAPLTRQRGEFFPLANGTSFSFPERGGWKREKWCPAGGK